jgi:glycosyltransferase involved in cell wall biosynthesis
MPTHISVIVPVYNEAENFPRLIEAIEKDFEPPFTVYMVYDFDADTTVPVARELAATRPWLQLVRNDLGKGVVNAYRAGFKKVGTGPALVVMADLSDDFSNLPAIRRLWDEGYRLVTPSRYMKGGQQIGGPPLKRFLSRVAGISLHYLSGIPTHDATNNYRLYDAGFVNSVGIEATGGFEIAIELTAKAFRSGLRIAEVPTTWRDRTAGESRFQLKKWLPKYLYWYGHAMGVHVPGLRP